MTSPALTLLSNLVGFDTVSHRSNLALIEYVERYLARYGVESTRIPSADGAKSSLLARIGPEAPGGIVLSGHTDVVPVEGQRWSSPPFYLEEREGRLYGRGTADMKGFIACALAMVPEWAANPPAAPIYLAFSYDEEVGCLGAPDLVAHLVKHLPRPRLVVIGEPTGMQVVTAHKGVYSFETTVTGKEAHSSQPQHGVNAVHVGARLAAFLVDLAEQTARDGPFNPRFEPAHSTVHVGVMHGGTARNIIPRQCRLHWEIRPLPGEDAQMQLTAFEAKCEELRWQSGAEITTQPRSRMEGFECELTPENLALLMRAAQVNDTLAVPFGTEAGVFFEQDLQVAVCGPGHIDQAHQPDEYVETAQIEACLAFLKRLTKSGQ